MVRFLLKASLAKITKPESAESRGRRPDRGVPGRRGDARGASSIDIKRKPFEKAKKGEEKKGRKKPPPKKAGADGGPVSHRLTGV